jgi:hypothetical protein
MTTTTEMTVDTTIDDERRDALVERLFGSLLGGMELLSIDLGRRLGLYATLSKSGAETPQGSPVTRVSPNATRGSGWSSRRSPASWTSRTPTGRRLSAATRCPPPTPTYSCTPSTRRT